MPGVVLRTRRRWWLAVACFLLLPAGQAAHTPAWHEPALDVLTGHLFDSEFGAIVETADPIDHGDVWAWSGDNAKALGALADGHGTDGEEVRRVLEFVRGLGQTDIVFQRKVNSASPVVIQGAVTGFEVSNHLVTLQGDLTEGRVEVFVEYHDGRDKRMAVLAPAQVLVEGDWHALGPSFRNGSVGVEAGVAFVSAHYRPLPGVWAEQRWSVGADPGLLEEVRVSSGQVEGVRFQASDLRVVTPQIGGEVRTYDRVYAEGLGTFPYGEQGLDVPVDSQWLAHFEVGRTDAFSNALGVAAAAGASTIDRTTVDRTGPTPAWWHELLGDGPVFGLRVVPFDGFRTQRPETLSGVMGNLDDPGLQGMDVSLSYEIGDMALGVARFAVATADDEALAQAGRWLEDYAPDYARGTQARGLAKAASAALLLFESTNESRWLDLAVELGLLLGDYRVTGAGDPSFGGVEAEPGLAPHLDAGIPAARAWHTLGQVTGDAFWFDWADLALVSIRVDGDTFWMDWGLEIRDDNHWAYKSGLALQAASAPEPLRWSARSHAWAVLGDVESMEFRTSRFSNGTNSETQSWLIDGLLTDWRSLESRPFVLDAEGPLAWAGQDAGGVLVDAPWPATWALVDPAWVPLDSSGPLPWVVGSHGYHRVELDAQSRFVRAERVGLPAGAVFWSTSGFGGNVSLGRVVGPAPVSVAWLYDASTASWVAVTPEEFVQTTLAAGQAFAVWMDAEGAAWRPVDGPAGAAPVSGRHVWSEGSSAVWVVDGAVAGLVAVEDLPLLVDGVVLDRGLPVRGQRVEVRVDGRAVGEPSTGVDGRFAVVVPGAGGSVVEAHVVRDGVTVDGQSFDFVHGGRAQAVLDLTPGVSPLPTAGVMLLLLAGSVFAGVLYVFRMRAERRP